ncbi:MAG: SAM-dependent methyltransferase [Rhodocyclaceae bacterium]|jgi:16S rRNA (cytidine1402-2'-O)-methyltransferase|nr:SAM-dependent methyltransferase [Rhodocyclaceae bacterium]
MSGAPGILYLVPASLGESPWERTLPAEARQTACRIQHYVVENARTARAELKRLDHPLPIRDIHIETLPEHPTATQLDALLAPALAGESLGLMSEAGCPAVADPGALLVARAHLKGIRVVPLVGPSSLLLALMASGLNGQSFAFHGYLPVDEGARNQRLKELEEESRQGQRTQLFIETPYRNARMFQAVLATCHPETRLCLARDLTTSDEWVRTLRISEWRRAQAPDLAKRPTIFLLQAG